MGRSAVTAAPQASHPGNDPFLIEQAARARLAEAANGERHSCVLLHYSALALMARESDEPETDDSEKP